MDLLERLEVEDGRTPDEDGAEGLSLSAAGRILLEGVLEDQIEELVVSSQLSAHHSLAVELDQQHSVHQQLQVWH